MLDVDNFSMDLDLCSACEYCDFLTYSTELLERHMNVEHRGMAVKSVTKMISLEVSARVRESDALSYLQLLQNTEENNLSDNGVEAGRSINPTSVSSEEEAINVSMVDPFVNDLPSAISKDLTPGPQNKVSPSKVFDKETVKFSSEREEEFPNFLFENLLGDSICLDSSGTHHLTNPVPHNDPHSHEEECVDALPQEVRNFAQTSQDGLTSKSSIVSSKSKFCLLCPFRDSGINTLKSHLYSLHPTGAPVARHGHSKQHGLFDVTFFCVREACDFSSPQVHVYQEHLMTCCPLREALSDDIKWRLKSVLNYIMDFLKRNHNIRASSRFLNYASYFKNGAFQRSVSRNAFEQEVEDTGNMDIGREFGPSKPLTKQLNVQRCNKEAMMADDYDEEDDDDEEDDEDGDINDKDYQLESESDEDEHETPRQSKKYVKVKHRKSKDDGKRKKSASMYGKRKQSHKLFYSSKNSIKDSHQIQTNSKLSARESNCDNFFNGSLSEHVNENQSERNSSSDYDNGFNETEEEHSRRGHSGKHLKSLTKCYKDTNSNEITSEHENKLQCLKESKSICQNAEAESLTRQEKSPCWICFKKSVLSLEDTRNVCNFCPRRASVSSETHTVGKSQKAVNFQNHREMNSDKNVVSKMAVDRKKGNHITPMRSSKMESPFNLSRDMFYVRMVVCDEGDQIVEGQIPECIYSEDGTITDRCDFYSASLPAYASKNVDPPKCTSKSKSADSPTYTTKSKSAGLPTCATKSKSAGLPTCATKSKSAGLPTCATKSKSAGPPTCVTKSKSAGPPTCTTKSRIAGLPTCATKSKSAGPPICPTKSKSAGPPACATKSKSAGPPTCATKCSGPPTGTTKCAGPPTCATKSKSAGPPTCATKCAGPPTCANKSKSAGLPVHAANSICPPAYVKLERNLLQGSARCEICKRSFQNQRSLIIHMRTHPDVKPFQCIQCGKRFQFRQLLFSHKRMHKADHLSQLYGSRGLKLHLEKYVAGKSFKCQKCDLKFLSYKCFREHLRNHRGPSFQCRVCKRCFDRKANLDRHIKIHSKGPVFRCTQCDIYYRTKSSLQCHLKSHAEKFKCIICSKGFHVKKYLDEHIMKVHKNKSSFKCIHCDKVFESRRTLAGHVGTHEIDKPFKCKKCNKSFFHRSSVGRHMKSHKMGKKVQWDEHGKYMLTSSALRVHMKNDMTVHMQEKSPSSYFCHQCHKTFTTKGNLVRHMLVHSMDNLYKCSW